jgi:hypothetical protein
MSGRSTTALPPRTAERVHAVRVARSVHVAHEEVEGHEPEAGAVPLAVGRVRVVVPRGILEPDGAVVGALGVRVPQPPALGLEPEVARGDGVLHRARGQARRGQGAQHDGLEARVDFGEEIGHAILGTRFTMSQISMASLAL